MSDQSIKPARFAFIGGGNMARAMIGGLIKMGIAAKEIIVSEPNVDLRDALSKDFGVQSTADNTIAAAHASIWLLAVKPQVMKIVCDDLKAAVEKSEPVVISIAAGITLASLQAWLGSKAKLVRAMPNTPALLGAGITGLFAHALSESEREQASQLMQACGKTVWIADEALMDAVTATSGSGPAYFFLLMEAMQQAAINQGLPPDAARALVLQTALGAAMMAVQSNEDVALLRQRVTSPGGTTAAAISSFEAAEFQSIVDAAIRAATERGKTLSAQFG